MKQIKFNLYNLFEQCICWKCPVQTTSSCVGKLSKEVKANAHQGKAADPKKADGLYCAKEVGSSPCQDMNGKTFCICLACPVWRKRGLKSSYFCFRGSAESFENKLRWSANDKV